MAKAVINLQKESGGIVKISPVDGIGVTEVTVPESGELVTKEYVDTGAGAVFVANDQRVKTALNAGGDAPIYACRAWVNFNGTGTVAIRASGNISSITDNGVGDYTLNFITPLSDTNYSIGGITKYRNLTGSSTGNVLLEISDKLPITDVMKTNSCRISTLSGTSYIDAFVVPVSVFR